jgi:hypothetical protein
MPGVVAGVTDDDHIFITVPTRPLSGDKVGILSHSLFAVKSVFSVIAVRTLAGVFRSDQNIPFQTIFDN